MSLSSREQRQRIEIEKLKKELEDVNQQIHKSKRELKYYQEEIDKLIANKKHKELEIEDLNIVQDGLQRRLNLKMKFLSNPSEVAVKTEPTEPPVEIVCLDDDSDDATDENENENDIQTNHQVHKEEKPVLTPSRSSQQIAFERAHQQLRDRYDKVEKIEKISLHTYEKDRKKEREKGKERNSSKKHHASPPSSPKTNSSSKTKYKEHDRKRHRLNDEEEKEWELNSRIDRSKSKTRITPQLIQNSEKSGQPKRVSASPTRSFTNYPDNFWGIVRKPKLILNYRISLVKDSTRRKLRVLRINPQKPDIMATGSDDGALVVWSYNRRSKSLSRELSILPSSIRTTQQCPEDLAWSPNGNNMAIGFRNESPNEGCIAIVKLHQLETHSNPTHEVRLPKHHVSHLRSSRYHLKGVTRVQWLTSSNGDVRGLISTGVSRELVYWMGSTYEPPNSNMRTQLFHDSHKSEIRSLCVHSDHSSIFTGGADGVVMKYDINTNTKSILLEQRRPSIDKMNSILEHPHNPHLLLISSISSNDQCIHLFDQREGGKSRMQLRLERRPNAKSFSQYIVPRWAPAGWHVSCGSTNGEVYIWDVRVGGSTFPVSRPTQALAVHGKQVLHATWHPKALALFSISHDRNIGVITYNP